MNIQRIASVTVAAALIMAGAVSSGCAKNGGAGNGSAGATKTGTSTDARPAVPDSARRIAEGSNRLIHRTLRDGTIYVVDGTDNRVLYHGPVQAGANIVVDPAANAITVNDQQIKFRGKLETHRMYQLFFQQT